MFEVGKSYTFTMIDPEGGTSDRGGKVEAYDHPLVKLADVDLTGNPFVPPGPGPHIIRGPIVNVTSANFVQAVLSDTV